MSPQADTVQKVAALASAFNHLRQNRIEYMLLTVLLYATGAGTALLTQAQGVCA
jgi:hypothetical protein